MLSRLKRYRPTQQVELSEAEILRMLRRGQDPSCGLNRFEVARIIRRGIERLAQRPEMLRVLARAVACQRELLDAQRGRQSTNASAELY